MDPSEIRALFRKFEANKKLTPVEADIVKAYRLGREDGAEWTEHFGLYEQDDTSIPDMKA